MSGDKMIKMLRGSRDPIHGKEPSAAKTSQITIGVPRWRPV